MHFIYNFIVVATKKIGLEVNAESTWLCLENRLQD